MKKPDHFYKRIAMSAIGVIICGVSVGMFKHASLGVDPFQSLMSGLDAVIPISFGTLYVLVNLVLLLFALLLDRRKIGLATLINLFLLGYIAQFSQGVCARLLPEPSLPVRLGLLSVAIVIMCLASAFYFTANLGVSTYDAVALIWSEKQTRIPFPICRIITDLICVVAGVALCVLAGFTLGQIFGEVGIGTIITAFFMGPLIELFNKTVARPFLYGRKNRE
jgi:Predicted membrane protein